MWLRGRRRLRWQPTSALEPRSREPSQTDMLSSCWLLRKRGGYEYDGFMGNDGMVSHEHWARLAMSSGRIRKRAM